MNANFFGFSVSGQRPLKRINVARKTDDLRILITLWDVKPADLDFFDLRAGLKIS